MIACLTAEYYLNKTIKNNQETNKKAPLMELRSFLRVGIRLVMTTTMTLLNQKKGIYAIWNHINALFVVTQTYILLDILTVSLIVVDASLLKAKKRNIIVPILKRRLSIFLMNCQQNKRAIR